MRELRFSISQSLTVSDFLCYTTRTVLLNFSVKALVKVWNFLYTYKVIKANS